MSVQPLYETQIQLYFERVMVAAPNHKFCLIKIRVNKWWFLSVEPFNSKPSVSQQQQRSCLMKLDLLKFPVALDMVKSASAVWHICCQYWCSNIMYFEVFFFFGSAMYASYTFSTIIITCVLLHSPQNGWSWIVAKCSWCYWVYGTSCVHSWIRCGFGNSHNICMYVVDSMLTRQKYGKMKFTCVKRTQTKSKSYVYWNFPFER